MFNFHFARHRYQDLTLQIVPPSARTICAQIAARLRVRRGGNTRRARFVEYCDQPAKNLKLVLRTRSAYRFGSRPYVTDCPAQRSHHIATIGDKRCVRSRWRCTWALARGIAKLGSCISAAVFMAVRLDMAALAQKLRQRHERGALVIDGATLLP